MILLRKMLREMRANAGQFLSILILSMIAVMVFVGFKADVVGGRQGLADFEEETSFADAWLYGEEFTNENLEAVRDLDSVGQAQFRTKITGSAPDYNDAQTDIYAEEENTLVRPYVTDGVPFDPEDRDGIWLNSSFADAWGISTGDSFTVEYSGLKFTKTVRGLIMTPEYIYTKADSDADTNFKNLAYVYLSYDALEETLSRAAKEEVFGGPDGFLAVFIGDVEIPRTQILIDLDSAELKDRDVMSFEEEIAEAVDGNYAVMTDKTLITGYNRFTSEMDQHNTFSYTFALIFVLIAVLVISITTKRMVERQRTQIGTMNAMGIRPAKLILHYTSYSFLVSAAGAVLGFVVGYRGLGSYMVNLFGSWYMLPVFEAGFNTASLLVILLVVAACTFMAWLSCRQLVRIAPAEALRPASPKSVKTTIFEKLPFWDRLGFSAQYNLRDLSRSKLRAVMGIVGTAAVMVMVVFSFGAWSLVDDAISWTFERIQNFGYEMAVADGADRDETEEIRDRLDGELVMSDAIEISAVKERASSEDKYTRTITVTEGKGLYNVTDPKTQVIELRPGDVGLTYRLANEMGVSPGDTVYWHLYSKNEWYASTVTVITRSPETGGIVMLRDDLEALGAEFEPSILVTDSPDAEKYRKNSNISSVYDMDELKEIYLENMSSVNMLVYFMIIFSVILGVVVLYNTGNISFHERLREFATLKVMGMDTGMIRRILNQENVWLAALGVLAGIPFAKPLMTEMMNSNGDNFDYYLNIPLWAYLVSGISVLGLACLTSFLFSGTIRRLDMVGSLKSAE